MHEHKKVANKLLLPILLADLFMLTASGVASLLHSPPLSQIEYALIFQLSVGPKNVNQSQNNTACQLTGPIFFTLPHTIHCAPIFS